MRRYGSDGEETMTSLEKISTGIEGLYVLEPCLHKDNRGYFFEAYNKQEYEKLGLDMNFVQDNESMNYKGVLRGLHVQKNYPQGKLIRVVAGTIYDVAVDLRKGSSTFCRWHGVELSADNNKQFYIPEGFAHGFYVKSEIAKVLFKVTEYWHPNDEIGIPWNDPDLNIDWNIPADEIPIIADKDAHYPPFKITMEMRDNQ